MRNEFTAILERDGDWYVAYCPEIPGANGQGRTKEEARTSLAEAIALILQDRREDSLRGVPCRRGARNGDRGVKRSSLLQHLRKHGCFLKPRGAGTFVVEQSGDRCCRGRPQTH